MKENHFKILVIGIVLMIWQLLSYSGIWNPLLFPDPLRTINYFFMNTDFILTTVTTSMKLLLTALIFSSCISLIVCSLAAISKKVRLTLETVLSLLSPIPSTSLLPFAMLWFGLGHEPILFVTVIGSLVVYILPIMNGFNNIPKIYTDVGKIYGLKTWKLIRYIYIPAALPSILTGIRAAWGLSWRALIAAELVYGAMGRSGGIGWLISFNRYHLNPNGMMSGLLCISMIGIFMEYILLGTIEKRTIKKWGMK